MQLAARSHLATITPIESGQARRVMNLPSLLMHNAAFVALQTGWLLLGIFSWALIRMPGGTERAVGVLGFWLAMMWLGCQFVIVFVYPEWPMNRLLSSRLRRSVSDRNDRPVWANDLDNRVVELVPRERWNQLLLDTATDLMLIRVDSLGVQMEGDCHRYDLPCESIIGVELHSIRPSGWFTDTHMVVIYARTGDGPVELPISYRDHQWGCLRNSRRREQALSLVDEINRIATGGSFGPLTAPSIEGEWERGSTDHTPGGNGAERRPPSSTINPYAAPSIVRD